MLNKNFYIKNEFLLNCDYINKYNLKSIYKSPKISNIVIDLPLNSLIKAYDFKHLSEKNLEIQIKSHFLLYSFLSCVPFINSNKLKIKKILNTGKLNYSLKVIISSKVDIYNFLHSLLIENLNTSLINNKKELNEITNRNKINFKKKILSIKVPAYNFKNLDSTIKSTIKNINSKELIFKINLLIHFVENIYSDNNLINNLPFFWTNIIKFNK